MRVSCFLFFLFAVLQFVYADEMKLREGLGNANGLNAETKKAISEGKQDTHDILKTTKELVSDQKELNSIQKPSSVKSKRPVGKSSRKWQKLKSVGKNVQGLLPDQKKSAKK